MLPPFILLVNGKLRHCETKWLRGSQVISERAGGCSQLSLISKACPSYWHSVFLLFKFLFSLKTLQLKCSLDSKISSLQQQQPNAWGHEEKKEGCGRHPLLHNVTTVPVKSWMMEETTQWPVCIMSLCAASCCLFLKTCSVENIPHCAH